MKEKTGRSYDALARRLGVSKSTLHRYCSGEGVPPSFTLLEQFARECQASQTQILELHRRWMRVQAVQIPEAEPGPRQPAERPDDRLTFPVPVLPASPDPSDSSDSSDSPAPSVPPRNARGRRTILRRSRAWSVAALAILVMGGILVWRLGDHFGADAESVKSCTERGGVKHTDARHDHYAWIRDFMCANRPETPLYLTVDGRERIGTLETQRSWFVCWELGRVQGGEATVWYYTQGDRTEPGGERWEGWGFAEAEHVDVSAHPPPNMPRCQFDSTLPE